MVILVACEESQEVCKAFRDAGHEAYSCDLQDCSGGHPEWHFNYSLFDVVNGGFLVNQLGQLVFIYEWDMMIGHPPCTYLTVTANKWLKDQPTLKSGSLVGEERRKAKKDAEDFFIKMFNFNIKKICLENPIGSMNSIIPPTQIIQPYYFGDMEQKTTCLWLKGLPKLYHNSEVGLFDTGITSVYNEMMELPKNIRERIYHLPPSKERSKLRSKTFPGIAKAMSKQWG